MLNLTVVLAPVCSSSFSIEAGKADGENHFDHHGAAADQPSPCNDPRIVAAPEGVEVGISHMDADTYVGLLRLAGTSLPEVDLSLMERIDNSGSAGVDKEDRTLHYMVGISQLARLVKFPWCPKEGQVDVSAEVAEMMTYSDEKIITMGSKAVEASEATYLDCQVEGKHWCGEQAKVGMWVIGEDNPFDPSRPYEDGVEVVVVHRKHFKSVSVYCKGDSMWEFSGATLAGVLFAGHPKACGSPRGEKITEVQALEVYKAVKVACCLDHSISKSFEKEALALMFKVALEHVEEARALGLTYWCPSIEGMFRLGAGEHQVELKVEFGHYGAQETPEKKLAFKVKDTTVRVFLHGWWAEADGFGPETHHEFKLV